MLNDKRLLVYLFLALRLMLLVVYLPEVFTLDGEQVERGLTTLGDFHEHYTYASQITADNLPYRHYWVEFPPVWIGLAALVARVVGGFTAWASVLYLIFLVCDLGNLLLLGRIGARLYDDETALGVMWVYALLAAPLVMLGWNFEVLVCLLLLAAFYAWLVKRHTLAALLLALGVLTKFIPVLLVGALWRFGGRWVAIGGVLLAGVALGGLLLWGGEMARVSLTIQAQKPSYQTLWALLDGNYGTGSLPDTRYTTSPEFFGNPPQVAAWLRLLPFAALGWWLYHLPMRDDDLNKLRFLTLTLLLFMLWSAGWSPQWVVLLLPWLLLNFPNRAGVLVALVLMGGAFFEYPLLFRAAGSTWLTGAGRPLLALLVLLRTALLLGGGGVLIRRMSGNI